MTSKLVCDFCKEGRDAISPGVDCIDLDIDMDDDGVIGGGKWHIFIGECHDPFDSVPNHIKPNICHVCFARAMLRYASSILTKGRYEL